MSRTRAQCTRCSQLFHLTLGESLGGKLGGLLVGGLVGGIGKHPLTVAAGAVIGGILGHFIIDDKILGACPNCAGPLQQLDDLIPS